MGDESHASHLRHLSTISTGASIVVVALGDELGAGVLVWSVGLFFVSLLISVACMAWKAFIDPLMGLEATWDYSVFWPTLLAYVSFLAGALVLVLSLLF